MCTWGLHTVWAGGVSAVKGRRSCKPPAWPECLRQPAIPMAMAVATGRRGNRTATAIMAMAVLNIDLRDACQLLTTFIPIYDVGDDVS